MAQAGMGRLLYRGNRCHLVSVRSKVQNRRHPATRLCRARVAGTCCIRPRAGCRRAAALFLFCVARVCCPTLPCWLVAGACQGGPAPQARRQVKVDQCLEATGDLDSRPSGVLRIPVLGRERTEEGGRK